MKKEFIINLSHSLIAFLFVYLIGCFVQMSFNISEWSDTARELVGIFGSISFVACVFVYPTRPNQD